jgi:hypothetical protein
MVDRSKETVAGAVWIIFTGHPAPKIKWGLNFYSFVCLSFYCTCCTLSAGVTLAIFFYIFSYEHILLIMASSSPLLEEDERTTSRNSSSSSSTTKWSNLFYSTFLGKDEIILAIEKIGNPTTSKQKDKKHLQFLIQRVSENPYSFDDILLKCSAAVRWQENHISSCKILIAIHEIIRYNRFYLHKYDNAIIFLSEIASYWKIHENYFLERYAAAIMNLCQLLTEYSVLSNIAFELGFVYSAKLKLHNFTNEELTAFITRLLTYQNTLILATIRQSTTVKENEKRSNQDALWVIIDESKKILPIIDFIIKMTEERQPTESHSNNSSVKSGDLLDFDNFGEVPYQHSGSEKVGEKNSLVYLKEQRETQEKTIQELEYKLHHS